MDHGDSRGVRGDRKGGRPRDVTPDAEKKFLDWLLLEPWHSLDEMVQFIQDDSGIHISRWTVLRILKRNNLTLKELRTKSPGRKPQSSPSKAT